MNPDPHVPEAELPGIHDYDIRIPVAGLGDNPATELAARVPAGGPDGAHSIGQAIAAAVHGALVDVAGLTRYHVNLDGITVTDVDGTPSPADLAAELDHVRRVLAGLAVKFPMLLQLTGPEYNAADPAGLRAIPFGDAIAFVAPGADPEPPPVPDPAGESLLLPNGDEPVPGDPAGEVDPDVRRIRARDFARFYPGELEALVAGAWRHVKIANLNQNTGQVTIEFHGIESLTRSHDELLIVRPATTESYGADLGRGSVAGKELLHAGRWWTITGAEFTGTFTDSYRVVLADRDDSMQTTFNRNDPVLLRRRPGMMWTGGQPRG